MVKAYWKNKYAWLAIGLALLAVVLLASRVGSNDEAMGVTTARGDTTTKVGVLGALESTGYEFRYRKVPRLEGYEIVSGEAIRGDNRVGFTVEIRLAGPFSDIRKRSEVNPQRPMLRYARGLEDAETVGNITYATAQQAQAYVGHGFELETSRAQAKMNVNISVALSELFAPEFQPGV